MNYEITNRIIKIYLDEKHVKSFPKSLEYVIEDVRINSELISKMNLKKKALQKEDVELLSKIVFPHFVDNYLDYLNKHEKYVYELIENATAIGTRLVNSKSGKRFELIFDNDVKIKCSEDIHKFSVNHLPVANLNY